jgi:hypothetical protein
MAQFKNVRKILVEKYFGASYAALVNQPGKNWKYTPSYSIEDLFIDRTGA